MTPPKFSCKKRGQRYLAFSPLRIGAAANPLLMGRCGRSVGGGLSQKQSHRRTGWWSPGPGKAEPEGGEGRAPEHEVPLLLHRPRPPGGGAHKESGEGGGLESG